MHLHGLSALQPCSLRSSEGKPGAIPVLQQQIAGAILTVSSSPEIRGKLCLLLPKSGTKSVSARFLEGKSCCFVFFSSYVQTNAGCN